jgi:hypothetical protein
MLFCIENKNTMNTQNDNIIKLYLSTPVLPVCSSVYLFGNSAVILLIRAFVAYTLSLLFINRCQYSLVKTTKNA